MKILITTDLYTTATNGVVTSVKNLFDELKHRGHDVRILTLSDNLKSYRHDSVYYIRSMPIGVYPNIRMPLTYRHKLITELIEWQPDIIHSQCEFFSFQYALRIAKLTHAPIVHTYHTMYEQYVTYVIPSKRLGRSLVRILSKKRLKPVNTIIVPSRKVGSTLRGYGLNNKICIVPSGISLEQHKQRISSEHREEMRKNFGCDKNQLVLINLGRLGTEKNLEELLNYFSLAAAEHKNVTCLIVGDGPAREHLQKQAVSLGIADRVVFTGMVAPDRVQEYYQLADVFVSASTSETQGLTYIEAAANGLPLLCRQDLCLCDVIEQGKNGYEYTCEKDFMEALHLIKSNPLWRIDAHKRSEEIAATFSKETFGTAVEQIYTKVIENMQEGKEN